MLFLLLNVVMKNRNYESLPTSNSCMEAPTRRANTLQEPQARLEKLRPGLLPTVPSPFAHSSHFIFSPLIVCLSLQRNILRPRSHALWRWIPGFAPPGLIESTAQSENARPHVSSLQISSATVDSVVRHQRCMDTLGGHDRLGWS